MLPHGGASFTSVFVIAVFARRIRLACKSDGTCHAVLEALEQALHDRRPFMVGASSTRTGAFVTCQSSIRNDWQKQGSNPRWKCWR